MTEQARRLAHRLPQGRPQPTAAARPRVPGFVPAKAVGTFVPRLTQKAFEKYGFSAATLLTDWEAIVGPALARDTRPERLKWPRSVDLHGEGAPEATGRPGATLLLKVDPARALDIEYKRAQILDRINGYFGYRAVADMRLVQEPIPRRETTSASSRPVACVRPTMRLVLEGVDDGLRAALERLQAGVVARAKAI